MKPTAIQIDWPISHDYEDFNIREQLEAGGDEGPLLVLSAEGRRRPGREQFVAVFRNVDWYIASLEHDGNVPRERWVGLVRGSDRENGDAAIVALQRLAHRLLSKVAQRPKPIGSRDRDQVSIAYGALTDAVDWDGDLAIENRGEGFANVSRMYPAWNPRCGFD
ncbi:hypothetical protein [uncultured Sphingomonas sp.]|uniref:hypothetical protein n=1 Tax=uncultured Sphingomonas sp. TaxID=158754 RepID=UPI0035CB3391